MEAMKGLRGRRELGVVETIYEEGEEDEDFSPSPSLSLPTTPLQGRVEAWSRATGREPDVLIRVEGSCFYLHKVPLAAKSAYLKRLLHKMSEITLSPPLNITAETFSLIADFCYGVDPVITPLNVAALRVAAELLEVTKTNSAGEESLQRTTEEFFRRAVSLGREYAIIIFRSSLSLMPDAETTAALVSRCIEAISLSEDVDDVFSCVDAVKEVEPEGFEILAESMRRGLNDSQDLLYRMVDLYLKENEDKLSEDQKTRICNSVDCTMLSPELLMHAVQNPKMPLLFVVQAMFVEQLHTRRSIISAVANRHNHHHHQRGSASTDAAVTLGTILSRDAALRQTAQLKASMYATRTRIHHLEEELEGMRKLLHESDPGTRSASFRFSSEDARIGRGETGSVSSSGFWVLTRSERTGGSNSSEGSISPTVEKGGFRRNLINRLKIAFRASGAGNKSENQDPSKGGEDVEAESGNKKVVVIKKDVPFRRPTRSSS